MRRRVWIGLVILGLCLGVVVTRAVWEGKSALARGDEAAAAGDDADAVRWWRRAARWYLPSAPHVAAAYQRLADLGAQAEAAGDLDTALAAFTGVRSSVLATRSFYVPYEDRLAEANQRIAAIMAARERGDEAGADLAARTAFHAKLLARDPAPSVAWTLVALAGFALWIGGGFAFALRAVGEDDRLVLRTAAYSGAAVALGLVIWLFGLSQA